MGKYIVKIKATAKKDLLKHKKSGNQAIRKKIIQILQELQIHPYTGTGKPELLKYELAGKWSRRLNKKDRLVYTVNRRYIRSNSFVRHWSLLRSMNF